MIKIIGLDAPAQTINAEAIPLGMFVARLNRNDSPKLLLKSYRGLTDVQFPGSTWDNPRFNLFDYRPVDVEIKILP